MQDVTIFNIYGEQALAADATRVSTMIARTQAPAGRAHWTSKPLLWQLGNTVTCCELVAKGMISKQSPASDAQPAGPRTKGALCH